METVQGDITVQQGMERVVSSTPMFYLMMAHPRCGTRRTFRVGELLSAMAEGKSEGHFITTYCEECEEAFSVEIFIGVDVDMGFSYLPNQMAVGEPVVDPAGMSKQESNPFGPDQDGNQQPV